MPVGLASPLPVARGIAFRGLVRVQKYRLAPPVRNAYYLMDKLFDTSQYRSG